MLQNSISAKCCKDKSDYNDINFEVNTLNERRKCVTHPLEEVNNALTIPSE